MQVTFSHQKSTKSAIKNLEMQIGQLAKQMAERPTETFVANTEKNPKVTFIRRESAKKEKRIEEDVSDEEGEKKKKEEGEKEKNNKSGDEAASIHLVK